MLLAVWQYADNRWLPDFISSSPSRVGVRLWDLLRSLDGWTDIWVTLQELLLGYGIGVLAGFVLGLGLGLWREAGAVFEPVLAAVNAVPKVALAPLFLIWMGIGIWSKVAIAAMTVSFVMFYSTFLGVRTVPQNLVDVLRVMGAGRWTVVRLVVVPAIVTPILAGLKTSVPFAMIGVVVGEFVAADSGVGYYIRSSTDAYDSAGLFAGIVILLAMVVAGNLVLGILQERLLAWRQP